jgi:uncharacterized protein YjbI with pentapeptide repeats
MIRERLVYDEVLNLYAAGRRDFSFTSISVGDLTGKDLSGINLTGASLVGGTMSNINLSEACLVGAKFSEVNIDGANLSGANLSNARFTGDIDCSNVDFTICCLESVVFTYADLRNSDFQGAYDANGAIWINCDFTGVTGLRYVWERSGGFGYWKCIFSSDGSEQTGGLLFISE